MRTFAEQVLAIDPTHYDAHLVLALVAMFDYDWRRAGEEFQLALAAPHVQPLVRYAYGAWYLAAVGRSEEAGRQATLALQEDPLNPLARLFPCLLLLMKDDPRGETESLKLLELHPDFWIAMHWLSPYYARHGRLGEARAYAERARRLVPYHQGITGNLAAILTLQGDAAGAASLLSDARPDATFGEPLLYFNYHVALGEFATAARWLEKCIERRDTRAPWILPYLCGPGFTASPHWPPLARKMNLPGF